MERISRYFHPVQAHHNISLSPSENYFIDSYSKPDVPSVTVLRDINGKQIMSWKKQMYQD